ncbi:unnamed protein product [Lasius platythorax]|uniref:Uncharacterized protein n=1 Tax=Lasius platythorax TaxID=488582 RepID=A0AAV2NQ02_9HYME
MVTHRSAAFGKIELPVQNARSRLGERRTAPRITGRSIIACESTKLEQRRLRDLFALNIRCYSRAPNSLEVRRDSPLPPPSELARAAGHGGRPKRRGISIGLLTSFRRFRFQGQLPVPPPHDAIDDDPAAAGGFLRISRHSVQTRRRDLPRARRDPVLEIRPGDRDSARRTDERTTVQRRSGRDANTLMLYPTRTENALAEKNVC